MPLKHLIIGMGVSGIAAAETIRSQDAAAEIALVTKDPHGYYSLPGLAYCITNEISETFLFPYKPEDFKRLHVHIHKTEVTQLDPVDHTVLLADGQRLAYDRLLLALGAQAVQPEMPGYNLPEVVTLNNLEDARRIIKLSRKTKAAVVVGGGITALEIVEGLRCHGVTVHFFLRGDRYWGNVLDQEESTIVESRLKAEKVIIHYNTELAEIKERKGHVDQVITRKGEAIRCSMVAIGIGVLPRKELAEKAGIKIDRGILVNEYLQTNLPDIYAAGDVAQVFDPYTGKYILDTLWGLARQQGTAAGMNMAGVKTAYRKAVSANFTRLAGLHTTIIGSVGQGRDADLVGIARGDSEAWRDNQESLSTESDMQVNHLRLMVGEKKLVGALLMGDQTLAYPLKVLIGEQIDISPIRDALLASGADTAGIIKNFWSNWEKRL
jgi:nitrite reductase (NADH) large subunit